MSDCAQGRGGTRERRRPTSSLRGGAGLLCPRPRCTTRETVNTASPRGRPRLPANAHRPPACPSDGHHTATSTPNRPRPAQGSDTASTSAIQDRRDSVLIGRLVNFAPPRPPASRRSSLHVRAAPVRLTSVDASDFAPLRGRTGALCRGTRGTVLRTREDVSQRGLLGSRGVSQRLNVEGVLRQAGGAALPRGRFWNEVHEWADLCSTGSRISSAPPGNYTEVALSARSGDPTPRPTGARAPSADRGFRAGPRRPLRRAPPSSCSASHAGLRVPDRLGCRIRRRMVNATAHLCPSACQPDMRSYAPRPTSNPRTALAFSDSACCGQ